MPLPEGPVFVDNKGCVSFFALIFLAACMVACAMHPKVALEACKRICTNVKNNHTRKFVVENKDKNYIVVKNKQSGRRIIEFSDACYDSIVYSNINVGDKLRVCDAWDNVAAVSVPNTRYNRNGNCDFRIKYINSKFTEKLIKEYEKNKREMDSRAAKIRGQQQVRLYIQNKRNVH